MNNYVKLLTATSLLIFTVLISLAIMNKTYGWIPDLAIFIILTIFYYWTYDTFRMNMPIFTLLIIGHVLHGTGVLGWYYASPVPIQWDHITHFFGTLPFALLFFKWMSQWLDKGITKKNILIIMAVFFSAMGVGAIVELFEFIGYLALGFGDGVLMFGPGDGIAGLQGTDLIDAIGGGWINEGWDFVYNTIGIITGLAIMITIRIAKKTNFK